MKCKTISGSLSYFLSCVNNGTGASCVIECEEKYITLIDLGYSISCIVAYEDVSYRISSEIYTIISKDINLCIPYYDYTEDDYFQMSTIIDSQHISIIIFLNKVRKFLLKMAMELKNEAS